MRVLITGITGFVGSHMADYILATVPDATVYASRRWRSRDENIVHLYSNPRVIFIEADLNDRGSLSALLAASRPDVVFHFAAQSFPETSFVYPVSTLLTNVVGTTNLLDEIRLARNAKVCDPVIVSVSSSEVYGMPLASEIPIKETNPLRAANPYSISKVGHDFMSQYYFKAFGMNVVTTRMFSHEGARRGAKFALSSFARQIAMHEKQALEATEPRRYAIMVGNLNSVRTYAHIQDAVAAYWAASLHGVAGEVYNIGGDETCTVGEALEMLLSKSTLPRDVFDVTVDPARIRPTDITLQVPDCTKFKVLTGWRPVRTLDDIANDLLTYWRGIV